MSLPHSLHCTFSRIDQNIQHGYSLLEPLLHYCVDLSCSYIRQNSCEASSFGLAVHQSLGPVVACHASKKTRCFSVSVIFTLVHNTKHKHALASKLASTHKHARKSHILSDMRIHSQPGERLVFFYISTKHTIISMQTLHPAQRKDDMTFSISHIHYIFQHKALVLIL